MAIPSKIVAALIVRSAVYDAGKVLRAAGFMQSDSTSRGDHFISTYQPSAPLRKKGMSGKFDISSDYTNEDKVKISLHGELTLDGDTVKLSEAGSDEEVVVKDALAVIKKSKLGHYFKI